MTLTKLVTLTLWASLPPASIRFRIENVHTVTRSCFLTTVLFTSWILQSSVSVTTAHADHIRDLQTQAAESKRAAWGYWGSDPTRYSTWTSHTNRLVPVYTFGIGLEAVRGENSVNRSPERLEQLYGRVPDGTLNPEAEYFDQTDVYHLQRIAAEQGKRRIILVIFDGMDWWTTWLAATHRAGRVAYREGRGAGLFFQDYDGAPTDYGYCVTSPHNEGTKADVNMQSVLNPGGTRFGGYAYRVAGETPWAKPIDLLYPVGKGSDYSHVYADSASSATSMTSGIKTYNGAINVDSRGRQSEPIARYLQRQGFAVGAVTSVPVSHATPAAAYANNVNRNDYQDLVRDMLGLKSIAHPDTPLPGLDVLIGAGVGVIREADSAQGDNFVPGNRYLTSGDLHAVSARNGGAYRTAIRTSGVSGSQNLENARQQAIENRQRLFGFFGVSNGHLPFQTADGQFDPTVGARRNSAGQTVTASAEKYSAADIEENPTLPEMTSAALNVLAGRSDRLWLMVEAGDVDWANHSNNIDNSIGAVHSGDDAIRTIAHWVEGNGGWDDTALIVTADHGHYLTLTQPEALVPATE